MKDREAIGRRLRECREYLGLSQTDAAEYMQVANTTVCMWESGQIGLTVRRLQQCAGLYKVTPEYILHGAQPTDAQYASVISPELYAQMKGLPEGDREQVERFAMFLRYAGRAPKLEREA